MVKLEDEMASIRKILNLGRMTSTGKYLTPTPANKYGVYHTGADYNLAPRTKIYTCEVCQDREIIEIHSDAHESPMYKPCACKDKKSVARKFKSSGLREQQRAYKLEDFKVNKDNRMMFEGVKQYLKEWPDLMKSSSDAKGFLLIGNAGIGKTMLSCIIAKDMLDKGVAVIFASSVDLFAELKQAQFAKDDEDMESKINTLAKVPCLILDDIGKEKPTEWIQSMYYRIIDTRYRNGLLTGFTTNYYPNELEARLENHGETTVSRILGMTKNYLLCARDYDHRTAR